MAMMMTGRVLLVCALCVLWCGAGGGDGSAVEYSFAGRLAWLRKECAEEVGRRIGGRVNVSAVEECVRRGMDGVRAVVDGRSRWRRQQFAVAAADGGPGDKSGKGSDDTLKVLSSSEQMPQAGQDPEERQEPKNSLEVKKKLETSEDSQITGEQNVSPDVDLSKKTGRQETAGGQPGDEKDTKNPQPPQPSPEPNKLQSEETHLPIPAEKHLKPQDGGHPQKKEMLQTKDSSQHEEGETIFSDTKRSASKEITEATTPLSASKSGSGIAGSTVENSGANNPQPPATSVKQHDSEGDTGSVALPASNTELRTEEISNAGIIATTHDDDSDDSSPAAPIAERPTAGTRSTQASGDASDLEQSNDDVNDDVAHKDKVAEFETSSGDRDTEADNERYTTVPQNATNKTINTEITADSAGSIAASHTTSPLLLLLVACAAAAVVAA
ncbi:Mucin-associated surface protein (MASP) [Trypanosoma cruzi]|uniref:Mucin-associated surface protein (MASP) n=2 Tax=Trypanosoma cruzi TaxID=5693 RepID=A0A2V2XJJ1_TRYCR|nr:Mucin-associated surface protein (MASP) [Trypanosoma cruzi]